MSDFSSEPTKPDVNAGALLACSILATVICGPLTIATWISANSAMRKLQSSNITQSSQRSLVQAAQIISVVGMVIWFVGSVMRISARKAADQRQYSTRYSR